MSQQWRSLEVACDTLAEFLEASIHQILYCRRPHVTQP